MRINTKSRALLFIMVAALHATAIFGIAWNMDTGIDKDSDAAAAKVMRLVDIEENRPPPPPELPHANQHISEAIAENLVETETDPSTVVAAAPAVPAASDDGTEEYISQSKISIMPRFDEKEILGRLVYPPIAQRAGIEEGRVVLELFVNKQGQITRLQVLKEEPTGRGFGDAAVRAFTGLKAVPAQSNGDVVAVRIRYPVRFQLK